MIKVYSGIKGFAVMLFFLAGVVLVFSIFSWGIARAIQLFLPLLIVLSYLLIVLFLLMVLPATFFKQLRPKLYLYSMLMSSLLGVSTWMMSFFYVVKAFGVGAMFFAFLFQFLAPVAFAGALFKGSWQIAINLFVWISFTYGMRFYAQWLLNLNSPKQKKGDIIDVEAVEVKNT